MTNYKSMPLRDRYDPEGCSLSLSLEFLHRVDPAVIGTVGRAVSEPITRPEIQTVWRPLWAALSPHLRWGQQDDDVELA